MTELTFRELMILGIMFNLFLVPLIALFLGLYIKILT